jgi:uncharacterized protein (DUF58 family)
MDLSKSMGYTLRQQLNKFDYSICLAAALCYMMVHQQDPVGLITFDDRVRQNLRPSARRAQIANILAHLSKLKPTGQTNLAHSLTQIGSLLSHRTLLMVFSDCLCNVENTIKSLSQLRHSGHDVILFHVLDEAEVHFPFHGVVELEDPESSQVLQVDADNFRKEYLREVNEFREHLRRESFQLGVDYVALDTSMQFDRALMGYLQSRRSRF